MRGLHLVAGMLLLLLFLSGCPQTPDRCGDGFCETAERNTCPADCELSQKTLDRDATLSGQPSSPQPGVQTGPRPECTSDVECNDGKSNTVDYCNAAGKCVHEVQSSTTRPSTTPPVTSPSYTGGTQSVGASCVSSSDCPLGTVCASPAFGQPPTCLATQPVPLPQPVAPYPGYPVPPPAPIPCTSDYDCPTNHFCRVGSTPYGPGAFCEPRACADLGGDLCTENETCSGQLLVTINGQSCCTQCSPKPSCDNVSCGEDQVCVNSVCEFRSCNSYISQHSNATVCQTGFGCAGEGVTAREGFCCFDSCIPEGQLCADNTQPGACSTTFQGWKCIALAEEFGLTVGNTLEGLEGAAAYDDKLLSIKLNDTRLENNQKRASVQIADHLGNNIRSLDLRAGDSHQSIRDASGQILFASQFTVRDIITGGTKSVILRFTDRYAFARDTACQPQQPPTPEPAAAPAAPTNLQATPTSHTQINLSWSAVTGATGYKVFRNDAEIASVTSTTYSDTGLAASTQYTYTVKAANAQNQLSAASTAATATTLAPPAQGADGIAPAAPANLEAQAISFSQVNLSWTASTDNVAVTAYKVYRNGVAAATVTTTTHSDTGLNASTQYRYRVSALDAAGNESTLSNERAVTTPAAPAGSPPAGYGALQTWKSGETTPLGSEWGVWDAGAILSGTQLSEVTLKIPNWTFNSATRYVRNRNLANNAVGALKPAQGSEKATFSSPHGYNYFDLHFDGFENVAYGNIKIGRGATESIGFLEFKDANSSQHKLPFYVPNLATASAPGAGRVFAFDEGSKQYYYEALTNHDFFIYYYAQPASTINGKATGITFHSPTLVTVSTNSSNDACVQKSVGDSCVLNGVSFAIQEINLVYGYYPYIASYSSVKLRAQGVFRLWQGTTAAGTKLAEVHLKSGVPPASPVTLKGLNDFEAKYYPIVNNAKNSVDLVLANQSLAADGGATLSFDGTLLNPTTPSYEPSIAGYYVRDDASFSVPGYSNSDAAPLTAVFAVKNLYSGPFYVYVDPANDRLVDDSEANRVPSQPEARVGPHDLRGRNPASNLEAVITNFGHRLAVNGSQAVLDYAKTPPRISYTLVIPGASPVQRMSFLNSNSLEFSAADTEFRVQSLSTLQSRFVPTTVKGVTYQTVFLERITTSADALFDASTAVEDVVLRVPASGEPVYQVAIANTPLTAPYNRANDGGDVTLYLFNKEYLVHSFTKENNQFVLKMWPKL